MSKIVAKLVQYEGIVQGVGFRFTANSLARDYSVVGYVMNLPNGDVEVHAEGPEDQVDGFLKAIAEELGQYIRETQVQELTPRGQYSKFGVRF